MRLSELREKRNLTQLQVARAVGISRPFYTNIENGVKTPSLRVAIRIAAFFGVDVKELWPFIGAQEVPECHSEEPKSA